MDDPCAGWWLDFDNADVDFWIRDPKKQKFLKHSLTSFQGFTQLQIALENGLFEVWDPDIEPRYNFYLNNISGFYLIFITVWYKIVSNVTFLIFIRFL